MEPGSTTSAPLRVAIIGPTGYAGREVIRLLAGHPSAEVTYLGSGREQLPDIREEFPSLSGLISEKVARCRPIDPQPIAEAADVAILGLPNRVAMAHTPALLEAGLRVIDHSADYRLRDADLYERTYGTRHEDRANLAHAVYGLPELEREQLPGATLVANPGCYPTTAALGVAPLLAHGLARAQRIIINAASGTTGAGRKVASHLQFSQQHNAFAAYGTLGSHRHQPEIEQTLSRQSGGRISTLFVPHLLPTDRGILETIYLDPVDPHVTEQMVIEAFEQAYGHEPFIRIRPTYGPLPNIKHVLHTNYVDLTARLTRTHDGQPTIVVLAALDNLVKGAAGQAVQNLNAIHHWPETLGLL